MYVVKCADGTLYTGYSPDVEARLAAHNAGRGAKYTKARLPVELVASAAFETKHEAMSAEWHFKRLSRTRKDELLKRAGEESFADILAAAFDLTPACEPLAGGDPAGRELDGEPPATDPPACEPSLPEPPASTQA